MHPQSRLPAGFDLENARAICQGACDRVVARLPAMRDDGAFAHWTDATLQFMQAGLPMIVDDCFRILEGEEAVLTSSDALYQYGANRAHTGVSPDQYLRVAMWTRRDILGLFREEIADELDPESRFVLFEAMYNITDDVVMQNMLGFTDELLTHTAEDDEAFGQLLRTTHAGLAIGDRDGNVVYVNDTFARYLGRRDSEFLNVPWKQAFVIPQFDDLVDECKEGEDIWRDIPCADEFGTTRMLRLSLRRDHGRLHAIAVDVSHQIEFEKMRREFVQGLIHDIRSPLTLISGWANTLLQSHEKLDAETRTKALETIGKAAGQVRDLTDDLLELELLEGGDHDFDLVAFEPAERIQTLLPNTDPSWIRVQTCGGTPVVCDLDAFDRIVTNLIANAFQHGANPVTISVEPDAASVRIDVADCGSIDSDLVERAFNGHVKSSTGFGIGLRVTHLLAEAVGGKIELTSADPTAFSVWLPTAPNADVGDLSPQT